MLKIFKYSGCPDDEWGTDGGIIFAENIDEANKILDKEVGENYAIEEIKPKKGLINICYYIE
jgi:hypothetical protein